MSIRVQAQRTTCKINRGPRYASKMQSTPRVFATKLNKFISPNITLKCIARQNTFLQNGSLLRPIGFKMPLVKGQLRRCYRQTVPPYYKKVDGDIKTYGWIVSGTAIGSLMYFFGNWPIVLSVVPLLLFNKRDLYILSKTFKRDITFCWLYAKCLMLSKNIPVSDLTVHKVYQQISRNHPDKTALEMNNEHWTFKDLDVYSNKFSRVLQELHLEKGDTIGIMSLNRPEIVGMLLGASQIGVIPALINYNEDVNAIAHFIKVVKCKILFVDKGLINVIKSVVKLQDSKIPIYQIGIGNLLVQDYKSLNQEMMSATSEPPETIWKLHHNDAFIYINSSGTTKPPKAAVIPHQKFLLTVFAGCIFHQLKPSDKVYNPLPIYHTVGLILGLGSVLLRGNTVVLKERFSAFDYFKDCMAYKCSVGMYIDEMCRYIMELDANDRDKTHGLRMIIGNGLNREIWPQFVRRFDVPIHEMYGSSEGNCNMINVDGKVGSVGMAPCIIPSYLFPYQLIKVSNEDSLPIRGPDGLCIECKYDEPGMLVGKIGNLTDNRFYGYVDKGVIKTNGNVVKDVFEKGDRAYMTHDILVRDEFRYFYFNDSMSDLFTWKNKKVSSMSVEEIASHLIQTTCACYGVKVGTLEGYAAMLAIEDNMKQVNVKQFCRDLEVYLPEYAIPRFLRFVKNVKKIGSHNIMKKELALQALDLHLISDPLFYLDKKARTYLPLTIKKLKDIQMEKIVI